ncbi:nicotinate-nucleotide--dimethylbenzimidazole phosphoribosyltransferase [Desulfocarbo indianensis]|nr:nicotinate-nucleotide--dimethylbenzimidazole phosphoribosyltransferase [Desulfocarbo indianensis]
MQRIQNLIQAVKAPDHGLAEAAQARLDNLTKPLGALGRLEELAKRLCILRGGLQLAQPRPAAAVFAADHGVALAGSSLYPREVTAQMVYNFLNGGAGINVLCRQVGATVQVVDVGVDHDFPEMPGLIQAKVARGSANLLEEPAMTREQTLEAMAAGAKVAGDLIKAGHDLLIPGEMGIGNTTPSAALAAAFLGLPAREVTGRGTGLDDEGLARKIGMVERALQKHQPDMSDPLGVLAALGGLEIAAIAGYALAAAANRVPVLMDGLISAAGCLCATRICPGVKAWLIAGHASVEAGQKAILADLGARPLVDLELRLGEGSGAALAVNIIQAAVAIYNEMATFESAGVTGH